MSDPAAPIGRLRPGLRIYAIGDVHGCLDRLVALHYAIAADLAARPIGESMLIHLGDYVDRGPDSAGVLWLLAGSVAPPVTRRVDLKGNHEAMMLSALAADNARTSESWLDNGGSTTLESYGVTPDSSWESWQEAIPIAHRKWMSQLDVVHVEGNYVFVHAGIRPDRTLEAQNVDDLLWIREPFLSDRTPRAQIVVHGHTPKPEPEVFDNRIGIDTGAVMGGKLTCVVLEEDTIAFMTA